MHRSQISLFYFPCFFYFYYYLFRFLRHVSFVYCVRHFKISDIHTSFPQLNLLFLNLLKPTGYVMHHQFNIQQLYALPTLYLYVLYLS